MKLRQIKSAATRCRIIKNTELGKSNPFTKDGFALKTPHHLYQILKEMKNGLCLINLLTHHGCNIQLYSYFVNP